MSQVTTRKVLITGCTSISCGIRTEVSSEGSLIVVVSRCLPGYVLDTGDGSLVKYEVTQRKVIPGEDLSEFDVAIVVLHNLYARSTLPYKFGALWAASQLPHVCVIDDWRIRAFLYTLRSEDLFWRIKHAEGSEEEAWDRAYPHRRTINVQYKKWVRSLPRTTAPVFPWGDLEVLLGSTRTRDGRPYHQFREFLPWDPSPLIVNLFDGDPVEAQADKQRRWIMSALQNEDEWLEAVGLSESGWRLHRQFKPVAGEHRSAWGRLPEKRVCNELYGTSWGVLAQTHETIEGAGWSRSRFVFCQQAGCVLWGEEIEVGGIGDAFRVHWRTVENMSSSELADLYVRQVAQFWSHQLSRDAAMKEIALFIERGYSDG